VLRFKSLGSGSTGNATVVESGHENPARLLVDCGFGLKHLLARLAVAGLHPDQIDAIFITHEHGDHVGCATALALRYQLPVWMSTGTYAAIGAPDFGGLLRIARDGEQIEVGAIVVSPFTVPHDAREPLQLTCSSGSAKIGILTDLGHATDHVLNHLQACSALLLESNHDSELLANSKYPAFLKHRVGGKYGHLSNEHAAHIAQAVGHSGLKAIVAAHLSLQNNTPALARECLSRAVSLADIEIVLADAASGCEWVEA
jgi:phosphoribosyl 1,2-cyclic phosphodiesterase